MVTMNSLVHRSVRFRCLGPLVVGVSVLLLAAGCANTSFAPQATSAVDSLRSTYTSAIIGASIIVLSALGLCTARGVLTSGNFLGWVVRVVVSSVVGFACAHTVLGQYSDWWLSVLIASGDL